MSYLREFEKPKLKDGYAVDPDFIVRKIAKIYEIPVAEIGAGRGQRIELAATATAAYLLRELSGLTWSAVCKYVRRKDHTTALNLYRVCARKMRDDPKYAAAILELIRDIKKESADQRVNAQT